MKKALIFSIIVGITLFSCKTTKKSARNPYEPATSQTTTQPKIFTVPQSKPKEVTEEVPVTTRQESFTFTQPQDQNQNSYFIIVGSFSSLDNAKRFRQTLSGQGFSPIIVQSETGYYRVTVDSFDNEPAARTRLLQIRQNYPQYADTWLLIKK
jgi:cell division protein FtsN